MTVYKARNEFKVLVGEEQMKLTDKLNQMLHEPERSSSDVQTIKEALSLAQDHDAYLEELDEEIEKENMNCTLGCPMIDCKDCSSKWCAEVKGLEKAKEIYFLPKNQPSPTL